MSEGPARDISSLQTIRRLGPVTGALALLWVMLWPSLHIPFEIIDDHDVIELVGRGGRLPLAHLVSSFWAHWPEPNGRFRPLYWLGYCVESVIAGRNSQWWHADRIALATVTLLACYTIGRLVLDPLPAALTALLPFCGPQAETWVRLGPAEGYAVPLATVGLALLGKGVVAHRSLRRLWPAFLMMGLASLAKENFLLLLGLTVAATVLWSRRSGQQWRGGERLLLAAVTTFIILDGLAIVWRVSSLGAQYPQHRTPATAARWAAYWFRATDPYELVLLCVLVLTALVAASAMRRRADRQLKNAGTLALALVVSQVAFYAGGPTQGRYLYPAAFAVPGLWVVILRRSPEYLPGLLARSRWLAFATLPLFALPIARGMLFGWQVADDHRTTAVAFQHALAGVERQAQTSRGRVIVLQPDLPETDTERVLSLARYLTADTGLTVMTTPYSRPAGTTFGRSLSHTVASWSRNGGDRLTAWSRTEYCFAIVFGHQAPACPTWASAPG